MTETTLVHRVLLAATKLHARFFRNNVGRAHTDDGRWIQYGLCVGSSDVIGWTQVTIEPRHVGRTIAVFTALECKVGKHTTTTEQGAFLATVREQGGIAAVVRKPEDAAAAVERFRA